MHLFAARAFIQHPVSTGVKITDKSGTVAALKALTPLLECTYRCTCMCVYTHAYTRTCIHIYTSACTCVHMHRLACTCLWMHAYTQKCTRTYAHAYRTKHRSGRNQETYAKNPVSLIPYSVLSQSQEPDKCRCLQGPSRYPPGFRWIRGGKTRGGGLVCDFPPRGRQDF